MKKASFALILSAALFLSPPAPCRADTDSAKDPLTAELLFEEASQAFKEQDNEKAVTLLKKSIELNPGKPESYYRVGFIYVSQGKPQEAVNYFKKATELNPNYTAAYINLGGSLGQLKQYNEALAAFFKALELDRHNPKIYYNVGIIYTLNNQKELAEEYFAKAKEFSAGKK